MGMPSPADPVELTYSDEGQGPAIVFLHGGGSDRTFWHHQVDHFSSRHRVICPDLRGHGETPAQRGDYSVATHASDVATLCSQLGVENATVVGHSLGGLIAFSFPALHPGLASRVIALDAPLLFQQDVVDLFSAFANADPSEFADTIRMQQQLLVSPDLDPDIRSKVDAALKASDLDGMFSSMRDVFRSHEENLSRCDVPCLCVNAAMPNDMVRLAELCPSLVWGRVVGSGHYLQLEVPDQVNAMMDRFLELI